MPKRSSKPPRDTNQLAEWIVDQATAEDDVRPEDDVEGADDAQGEPEKNPAAVALGRLGGKKGGKARAEKLSPERRSEIARKAARARWANRDHQKEVE